MTRSLTFLAAAATTLIVPALMSGQAEAGRFRGGGGFHVSAGARVHVSIPHISVGWSRPAYRARTSWNIGGSIHIGGGYYPRYRHYRPYYYAPVPSYYSTYNASYYPVDGTPAVAAAAVIVRPELPKFGIGLFAGGVSVQNQDDSSDVGVLGRFRLTPGLLIEAELGKTSYQDDLRVDRRLGASLVYEIGAYNKFAPYVVAGLGVQQASVADRYETTQDFGEIGIGLRYAISPRVHLALDVRGGSRGAIAVSDSGGTVANGPKADSTARSVTTSTSNPPTDETEEYTRARLSAIVYF